MPTGMSGAAGKGSGKKGKATLVEKFKEYHAARPDTYVAFKKHAIRLRRMGHKNLSAQYIIDYLRYETPTDGRPEDEWKLNNSYAAFYARMLRYQLPHFGPLFEFRASIADEVDVASLLTRTVD